MSHAAVNQQEFIERIAETFEASSSLFPSETTGESLITKVIRNKPAIVQSPDVGLIPYIAVFSSGQPITFLEKAGRDTRDAEGGSVYELSFYCVAVTDIKITSQQAQQTSDKITQAMRDALSRNLRLAKPSDKTNPLCRTTTRYQVPYLLPGTAPPALQAMNVVVKPQVYVSPRN